MRFGHPRSLLVSDVLVATASPRGDCTRHLATAAVKVTIIIDYQMESHSISVYFPQYFFSTINIVNRKYWILSCLESQKNFLQKIDGENVPCDINI
jgi:hypothetical protein